MSEYGHIHTWRPGAGTVKDGKVDTVHAWFCVVKGCKVGFMHPDNQAIPDPEAYYRRMVRRICTVCGASGDEPCRSTDMRHPGKDLNWHHRARVV